MTVAASQTRSVVVERELPHSPERVWRAITQPQLMEEWLMKGDFSPVVGHRFSFRAEWGTIEGDVLEVEPTRRLTYSWGDHDLKTVVSWTLTPTGIGTQLRMEQTGFRSDQPRYYGGAKAGWPRFLEALEEVLSRNWE
ncbi:SRPBCC family protein [Lutibaculum baratangense]|uniref:Activator of Hsp90 ATPase homologue 1/2-like C-terminal domain-containing protein n=1 Tax=Lutibaculum baratangense AMV1 TaxID=631454 RepID=V4T7Y7_9HYPH|nr:SRPBCC domain-containing protein [Lutibaculum baratangense]ESR22718.1 hypothetical protein N177_3855 [Lutibaculum baratangense AMV1]